MEDKSFTLRCDTCNTLNQSDAKFCKKCGSALASKIQKCKQCGVSNELTAIFCKSCGVNLAEAKIGVTTERAKEWWNLLISFEFYKRIWSQGATGHFINNQCKQLKDAQYPLLQYTAVFAIPITSLDWCIRSIIIGKREIINGELLCAATELIIFDLQNKTAKVISYSEILKVTLNNSTQHGLIQQIQLTDGSIINIYVKENSKAGINLTVGSNIVGSLFSVFSGKSESLADTEIKDRAEEKARQQYNQSHEIGVNFWKQVTAFFDEVYSHA